jgi:hypothetical protein
MDCKRLLMPCLLKMFFLENGKSKEIIRGTTLKIDPVSRFEALMASGGRCEHVYPDGVRCACRSNLQAHHKDYSAFSAEHPDHLIILCEYHHIVILHAKKEQLS